MQSTVFPEHSVAQVLLPEAPYRELDKTRSWLEQGTWPANWIACDTDALLPWVAVYKCQFTLQQPDTICVHVAADERYELYLDGDYAGRGSERGSPESWYFDTYDLKLAAGAHLLVARVWTLGKYAPRSQMSLRPGFLLSPDDDRWTEMLATGVAPWQGKLLQGYEFQPPFPHQFYSIGHNLVVTANAGSNSWRVGGGEEWPPVRKLHAGSDAVRRTRIGGEHLLRPAMLPAQTSTLQTSGVVRHAMTLADSSASKSAYLANQHNRTLAAAWGGLWKDREPLTVPAHTCLRVLIDFEDYVCIYPSFQSMGGAGASIRLHWAESLFCISDSTLGVEGHVGAVEKAKGNRGEIEGKYFVGVGDTCHPAGIRGFVFDTPFWRAGRYLDILIETKDDALILSNFALHDSRYPLEFEGSFESDDTRLKGIYEKAVRTLSASCHDTYVDPYYEQMMWAGDGVQNLLANFVFSRDSLLAKKWIKTLHDSRLPSGLTCARYPAKDNLLIAPYALYWVQGLKEYAWWRGDEAFVREYLPGAREVVQVFERYVGDEGYLISPEGWNFVDWVPEWKDGIPPGGNFEASAVINWHWILAMVQLAELETTFGESEMAERHQRVARACADAVMKAFWSEEHGLFADTPAKESFSEHAQCFAILSGLLPAPICARIMSSLLNSQQMQCATISFSHYLFEAYCKAGEVARIFGRLQLWYGLDKLDLLTLPEGPEPSRSDCHSWSTHPVYHFQASVLGVRPGSFGFQTVEIRPQFGPLKQIESQLVHPHGMIHASLRVEAGRLQGMVHLPNGLKGKLYWGENVIALSGNTSIDASCI